MEMIPGSRDDVSQMRRSWLAIVPLGFGAGGEVPDWVSSGVETISR
jgi:hypothetical protein